ncbi:uncharacterized protein LOC128395405 isoform X2 [Panonychus citri]|uniref:uncharacterized protein LOC128395405 isoform X2 n=1 Tax=Panonychus citri TaxID=50023 RepID=UPI002306E81F|nr:uncharacterized protein LOC128395405 isoform X2 [Panonychus citri]
MAPEKILFLHYSLLIWIIFSFFSSDDFVSHLHKEMMVNFFQWKCCLQYQAWLSPLIGTEDVFSEYIDAMAGEAMNEAGIVEGYPDVPGGHMVTINDPSQIAGIPMMPGPPPLPPHPSPVIADAA